MDFTNDGGSVYHRLLALYLRTSEGEIIRSIGQQAKTFETIWPSIETKVIESSKECPNGDVIIPNITIDDDSSDVRSVAVIEQPTSESTDIIGIVMIVKDDSSSISEFTKLFAKIVISQSVLISTEANNSDETEKITQSLTDLFDNYLRFESRDDKWKAEGREYFAERVRYFVSRDLRIDACLPAFPCKSSNPEKVSGEDPDKGEELALRRIHNFVQEVEKIYTPGACIWIVSDGHVFSDCIGVDDPTVDTYGEKLQDMNKKISEELDNDERVCFRSLIDIFDLQSHIDDLRQTTQDLDIPGVDHHIDSEHTDEAEVSRQILMAGCAPDPEALRKRIKSDDKSMVSLYRGFSRFMLEDLSLHPAAEDLSKKKRKKLAEKVSFEMIQRNQAYSNLIEMVFPDHIRLSIHAHNNAGPKFGIQLFDRDTVRATDDLSPDSIKTSTDDLLHIPTPWHNCVAEVEGNPVLHVVKSKNVEEVLDDKVYDGGFVEGDIEEGKGGFFVLKDLTGTIAKEPVDETATKMESLGIKGTSSHSSHSSISSTSVVSEDSSSKSDKAPEMDEVSVDEVSSDTKNVEGSAEEVLTHEKNSDTSPDEADRPADEVPSDTKNVEGSAEEASTDKENSDAAPEKANCPAEEVSSESNNVDCSVDKVSSDTKNAEASTEEASVEQENQDTASNKVDCPAEEVSSDTNNVDCSVDEVSIDTKNIDPSAEEASTDKKNPDTAPDMDECSVKEPVLSDDKKSNDTPDPADSPAEEQTSIDTKKPDSTLKVADGSAKEPVLIDDEKPDNKPEVAESPAEEPAVIVDKKPDNTPEVAESLAKEAAVIDAKQPDMAPELADSPTEEQASIDTKKLDNTPDVAHGSVEEPAVIDAKQPDIAPNLAETPAQESALTDTKNDQSKDITV